MEYLIGSIVTIVVIYFVHKFLIKKAKQNDSIQVVYSQTNVFEIIRPFLPEIVKSKTPTQSSKHFSSMFTKYLILKDKAYWIKNNTFFVADIIDGEIDDESTMPVDVINMDEKQLSEVMKIIERLTEEENDSWNSK